MGFLLTKRYVMPLLEPQYHLKYPRLGVDSPEQKQEDGDIKKFVIDMLRNPVSISQRGVCV